MKTPFLVALFALFCSASFAQSQTETDTVPGYKKTPLIPYFKLMVLPDSTAFTKESLKKKKETIIMIFSPDCEHCIHSTEDLLAHYDLFKNVQIVMGTPLAYSHIQEFYKKYKIADYRNITVGLDNTYSLGQFYKIKSYPAIFIYGEDGQFKTFFDGSVKWEKIAQSL